MDVNMSKSTITCGFYDQVARDDTSMSARKCLDEQKHIVTTLQSAKGADAWLLANHPDYYMGFQCVTEIEGLCSSSASAVPCCEYPDGSWKTWADRRGYAKVKADEFGVNLGAIEHDRDGDRINMDMGKICYYTEDGKDARFQLVCKGMSTKDDESFYRLKVMQSEGADTDICEIKNGGEYWFSDVEMGNYFSDIDNEGKHLAYLKGNQKEKSHEHLPKKDLNVVRELPDAELVNDGFEKSDIGFQY